MRRNKSGYQYDTNDGQNRGSLQKCKRTNIVLYYVSLIQINSWYLYIEQAPLPLQRKHTIEPGDEE